VTQETVRFYFVVDPDPGSPDPDDSLVTIETSIDSQK